MAPQDILIVGCGVVGPALATFLLMAPVAAGEKPRITILERAPGLRDQGQNVDIRGAGATVMRKLGIESQVRAALTGEEGTAFVTSSGFNYARFPADKTGQIQTGTSDLEILRGTLSKLLHDRSTIQSDKVKAKGGQGIEYIFGDTVSDLQQDEKKVHVTFANSKIKKSFDLVVGADGLLSKTRRLAFGHEDDEARIKFLNMYTAFFSIPAIKTDSDWMLWYHTTRRRSIVIRPSGDPKTKTAFVSVMSSTDPRFRQVTEGGRDAVQAQKELMCEYLQSAGWQSDRIAKEIRAAQDFYYAPIAQVKMDKWSKGRVVLVGDAAYGPSPISGMGTTVGLVGAYDLAGSIIRNPGDHDAAFAEYEATLRPGVKKAQDLFPGAPGIANPETWWGLLIMKVLFFSISYSGLGMLMFKFFGPPANEVQVKEYGFVDDD